MATALTERGEVESEEEERAVKIRKYNDIPFTAGLDHDIERLIYKVFDEFDKKQEPRFAIFTQIWKETQFGLIFCGRDSFRETYDLTAELFDRVKRFCFSKFNGKINNTLVRYAGIYLLYSLYFKQPCVPKIKIRLTLDEFRDLQCLLEEAKHDKHFDVLYAWAKLFTSYAIHYSVCSKQMGMEVATQLEVRETEDKSKTRPFESYFQTKDFKSMMRNLTRAHEKYVGMKSSLLSGPEAEAGEAELVLCDQRLPTTLQDLANSISDAGVAEEREGAGESGGGRDKSSGPRDVIGEKRKSIKERFFATTTDMTHRDKLLARESASELDQSQDTEEGEGGGSDWKPTQPKSRKVSRRKGKWKSNPAVRGRKRVGKGKLDE